MIDKRAAGQRIAALRRELGYSQARFAEKLNVSTQAVSKWETGLSLPDVETLLDISWMAKISVNEILDGEEFPAQSGLERGLARISRHLICPACGKALHVCVPIRQEKPRFACENGHGYNVVDGVLDFGVRETEGELWSLFLKNYEQYLEEQRHPGNPRYWQGEPNFRELMWQALERIRPRTILDIACGTGGGIKYMIERIHWPVTILFVDLSHRILKWNRKYFTDEWKNPYADLVCLACDGAKLPLADESIDLVFSNGGFESMQVKMRDGFREAYRVLKPGAHALYNMSAIEDRNGENSRKWIRLLQELDGFDRFFGQENLQDIQTWLTFCGQTGFRKNDARKVYGELPAPEQDVFPFQNEVLQWMAEYVVLSEK